MNRGPEQFGLRKPIEIATRATAEFLAAHLSPGASLIEVGCGDGQVARELLDRGYHVTGVDSGEAVIAQARARGVIAFCADWLEFVAEPSDAVAFTRSLHHISPLERALAKAHALLRPNGRLLVEDFAFDTADPETIEWFRQMIGSPTGQSLILPVAGEFITQLLDSKEPSEIWLKNHDHEIPTIAVMIKAVEAQFTIHEILRLPYLYRYLVRVLPETRSAATFVAEVLAEEARLGELGAIQLIGRRILATPRAVPA